MNKLKVMTVFGTRPEAIKMAPLALELQRCPQIESSVCVTAQHREMLDAVLGAFALTPDYDLNIMQSGQSLSDITTRALRGMDGVLEEAKPDLVLVHGDTSTTFAGALSAFYHRVDVGHVEAGLRTRDRYSPYPEEMNRTLVGDLAALHFAPTEANRANLERESVAGRTFVTGNTVIDALGLTVREDYTFESPELRRLDLSGKRVILVTAHRRENQGRPMEQIMTALRDIAARYEDVLLIYPVHLSPAVQEPARRILGDAERVVLTAPLGVIDMHNLMARCYMVMTDSGGLQEEAPALGKPVLVLRRETERPEAVRAGTVKLAGNEYDNIVALAARLLEDPEEYRAMARAVNPYGDGQACRRIVQAILWHYGLRESPPDTFGG